MIEEDSFRREGDEASDDVKGFRNMLVSCALLKVMFPWCDVRQMTPGQPGEIELPGELTRVPMACFFLFSPFLSLFSLFFFFIHVNIIIISSYLSPSTFSNITYCLLFIFIYLFFLFFLVLSFMLLSSSSSLISFHTNFSLL